MVLKGNYIGGHTVYGGRPVTSGLAQSSLFWHAPDAPNIVNVPISSVGFADEHIVALTLPRTGERNIG